MRSGFSGSLYLGGSAWGALALGALVAGCGTGQQAVSTVASGPETTGDVGPNSAGIGTSKPSSGVQSGAPEPVGVPGAALSVTASVTRVPAASTSVSASLGASAAPSVALNTPSETRYVATAAATWGGMPFGMLPYALSGTRLAAMGSADEGAAVFRTLRDTGLGFDCIFAKAETGDLHCVPKNYAALIFLDANCSEPAAPEPEGSFNAYTGKYVVIGGPAGTSYAERQELPKHGPVYRVAEKVRERGAYGTTPETSGLFTLSGGVCVGTAPRVGKEVPNIYRLLPVADSELVAATVLELPLEGGLTLERLVSSDGAEISSGLKQAGKRCLLQTDGNCAPTPIATKNRYSDGACTEPGYALEFVPAPGIQVYGLEYREDETFKVYELLETDTLFSQKLEFKIVMEGDRTTILESVVGCEAGGLSVGQEAMFHRSKDITEQVPKLNKTQFGTSRLRPEWLTAVVVGSDVSIAVRHVSESTFGAAKDIKTSDGKSCEVSSPTGCYFDDGTRLPLVEIKL